MRINENVNVNESEIQDLSHFDFEIKKKRNFDNQKWTIKMIQEWVVVQLYGDDLIKENKQNHYFNIINSIRIMSRNLKFQICKTLSSTYL